MVRRGHELQPRAPDDLVEPLVTEDEGAARHQRGQGHAAAFALGTAHLENVDEVGSQLTAAQIRSWLTDPVSNAEKEKKDRKPAMKPVTAPKEDVDALVAYLSTLKKK